MGMQELEVFHLCLHGRRYEPCHEETCLMPYVKNKDADQPAQMCSLISVFVVHCLDSRISPVAKPTILRL